MEAAYLVTVRPHRRERPGETTATENAAPDCGPQEVLCALCAQKTGASTAASLTLSELFDPRLRCIACRGLSRRHGRCRWDTEVRHQGSSRQLRRPELQLRAPVSPVTKDPQQRSAPPPATWTSKVHFESPGAPNEGCNCACILSVRAPAGYLSSGALSAFRRSSHASAHHGARSAHFRRSATRRATLAVCLSSLRKATLRLTLRRRPRRRARVAMRRGW